MSIQAVNSPIINTITPRDYGAVRSEYEALRHAAAVIELPFTALLEVSGKNAVQFLNGLVTNDVKALPPGAGTLAAFLNVQGKVVALCRFYHTGEKFLIELDAQYREVIFKNLSRFVPAGEFFVSDVTEQNSVLSLQGPKAAKLLSELMAQELEAEPEYRNYSGEINGTKILLVSHSRCGEKGFDLIMTSTDKSQIRQALLERDATALGSEALEIARLEAGIPREGVDVDENNILLEAGFEKAISYTKGCYLGQEVIARIHWRGQPAKQLRGLLIEANDVPKKGTELWTEDGKKVGVITSSIKSLALDRIIAFGYVHRYYLAVGTKFILRQNEVELGRAIITELPFVQ